MKKIKKTIKERYKEDASRWYCEDCGKGHQYLGEIAGTNQKCCEGCGKTGLLKKYEWLAN